MANTLSITAAMYAQQGNTGAPLNLGVTALIVAWTAGEAIFNPGFPVPAVEAAIPLGGLTAPFGRYWFRNTDPTNSFSVKAASAGQILFTLLPGEVAMGRFPSTVTAPTWISSAGTPLAEYAILLP